MEMLNKESYQPAEYLQQSRATVAMLEERKGGDFDKRDLYHNYYTTHVFSRPFF